MWKAVIPLLLQVTQPSWVLCDGTYECGDHGRFEYCIDEIPGCIIGCHCHPGYYFDTDSKICEPNSKLIEHHRRQKVGEQVQSQKNNVTPNVIYDPEPASSTSKIDRNVDEITKDANDLGDWLYNQFFKTIENQVINKTNDKDVLTRRSVSQPIKKSERSKKLRKHGNFMKKKEKKQLRRKLLRITENDSLFDISSKSSSDSSDSRSSSDLSSMEYEMDENNRHIHDDDEHGHKKIVMINKKPKQQLPSFIFLPNLDTPFYPPIGLPPPPIVPMYPMVPVPPVALCPAAGCHENGDKDHAATTASTQATAAGAVANNNTNTALPTIFTRIESYSPEKTSVTAPTTDGDANTEIPEANTKALRFKDMKKKKAARLLNNDGRDTRPGINSSKYSDRQKILQRLNEKMNNPSANVFMPSWKKSKKILENKFVNPNTVADSPFLYNEVVNDDLNNEINSQPMDGETLPDNVDFKYITELIHHVNLNNKSNDLPPIAYNPLDSMELHRSPKIRKNKFSDYTVPFNTPDSRRSNRPIYDNPDESYYANLGRQIAAMIRGIDTQKDVELETHRKIKEDPYLTNSPTSFWERSVRSPLAYLKSKNKKYEYLKRSNELLYDIENKVEIIASTAPALTLQEIENIVNVMDAAKRDIQRKNKPKAKDPTISYKNLNIDLWPQKSMNSYKDSVLLYLKKVKQEKSENINYKTNNDEIIKPNRNFTGVHMQSIQKLVAWNNRNFKPINKTHTILSTIKPSIKNNNLNVAPHNNNFETQPNKIRQVSARSSPFLQYNIEQAFTNQQTNPYILHHRKYFQDNYNYYANPNYELPRLPPVDKIAAVQPAYLSEINQFHYIE